MTKYIQNQLTASHIYRALGANCEQRLAATNYDHAKKHSANCELPRADEPSVRFPSGVNEKRVIRQMSYYSF